jgi:SAM-dependent methyltransferase
MDFGKEVKNCRMCDSKNINWFLDLGFAPLTDGILSKEDLNDAEIYYPLKIFQCNVCGLTQVGYIVNQDIRYGKKFKYESSITRTGVEHYHTMASAICTRFSFTEDSLVVDIGSNVGVLLEGFQKEKMQVLGVDPAPQIVLKANERGIETWQEYFSPQVVEKIILEKSKAKIICITNVFNHIDYKQKLIEAVEMLLDDDGIFVIETPYLLRMIQNFEYDKMFHEHVTYDSVKPIILFLEKYGLEVFDVEENAIQGGSIRIFIARKGRYPVSVHVQNLLVLEENEGLYSPEILQRFSKKVEEHRNNLLSLLRGIRSEGGRIVGISAPAKGNMLLNYCKIGQELIEYITEKADIKIGHYTPGMHIPIVSEEKLKTDSPEYAVIFAWNFAKEITKNNSYFHEKGGRFIIPFPTPYILQDIE